MTDPAATSGCSGDGPAVRPGASVRIDVMPLPHGEGLPLPARATEGASGVDLMAAVAPGEQLVIPPGEWRLVPTGMVVSIPEGWEWQVRPRSGLALRKGLTVLNAPGTIDSDYRGEVGVILHNAGREPALVERGERIAQAVLAPVGVPQLALRRSLDGTERGDGGFGHTG